MTPLPSSKLNNLPARPPTPPRAGTRPAQSAVPSQLELDKTIDDAVQYLDDAFEIERVTSSEPRQRQNKPLVDTPQQSPLLPVGSTRTSSKRKHKVAFAPFTDWHYHQTPTHASTLSAQPSLKTLPSSREKENGSVKSILKITKQPLADRLQQSVAPIAPSNVAAHRFNSLPDMFEAVTRQLAGDAVDRSAKRDAYNSLYSTLQTYKEIPDIEALQAQTPLLLQFIQRDASAVNPLTNGPDVEVITSALKLLACLLRLPEVADKTDDTTRTSLIDMSIFALQDTSTPKAVVKDHLSTLVWQKYSNKILKPDRLRRLLDTVHEIHEHTKGNSIPGYQIEIYRRLIEQVPDLMLDRAPQWLDTVFSCLHSDVDDIRERSIKVGMAVARQLGSRKEIMDYINERFDAELDGKSYGQNFADKLTSMLLDPVRAPSVPQIWSVVNLLSRANFSKFWGQRNKHQLQSWLSVNQKAFAGTYKIKIAARTAWSQYIFCINPTISTGERDRNLLLKPVVTYFAQMKSKDLTCESARASISMYLALLYYAFRPGASFDQLDSYWGPCIQEVLSTFSGQVENGKEHAKLACIILTSLLGSSAPWRETRAFDDTLFQIDELPRLDSRWVRSRVQTVMSLVKELCGNVTSHGTGSPVPDRTCLAEVEALLGAFIKSLSNAGGKEITLSKDARHAIACLTGFLRELSDKRGMNSETITAMVETAVQQLSTTAFTETYLSRKDTNPRDSMFDVASTPSHRYSKTGDSSLPAIAHILTLLLRHDNLDSVKSILEACCSLKKSRLSKLELIGACANVAAKDFTDPDEDEPQPRHLEPFLEVATGVFTSSGSASSMGDSKVGRDYEVALRITEICLVDPFQRTKELLQSFYHAVATAVQRETGDGGLLLAVTEPHAALVCRMLQEEAPSRITADAIFGLVSCILADDTRPNHRRDIDRGRAALWAEVTKERKVKDLDAYHDLYEMIKEAFFFVYGDDIPGLFEAQMPGLANSVRLYLERTPARFQIIVLSKVQDGIGILVEDPERKWKDYPEAHTMVKQLWDTTMGILRTLNTPTSNHLETFEPIFAAGLFSNRQSFMNSTVVLWNSTFGKAHTLIYTSKIEEGLRRVEPFYDVNTPGLEQMSGEEIGERWEDAPSVDESVEEDRADQLEAQIQTQGHSLLESLPQSPAQPSIRLSLSPRQTPSVIPSTSKSLGASPFKTQPKPKLRHDHSQIEFTRVDTSPGPEQEDSQLLTDRQKEVAERQRREAPSMFADIRSSPMYKRIEHDVDVLGRTMTVKESDANKTKVDRDDPSVYDFPKSSEDRAATPVLDVPSDDLSKSSSPIPSSPIASALSRRTTPKKSDLAQPQEQEDEIPSSPPRQSMEEEDPTQEFDMLATLRGIAGGQHFGMIESTEEDDSQLINATISPARLAELETSHDDLVQEARERFGVISSLTAGTYIITGTDDRVEQEQQPVADGNSTAGVHDSILDYLSMDAEGMQPSSPAPSLSGMLADRQLRTEFETSMLRSQDMPSFPLDSQPMASSIPSTQSNVVSKSFTAIVPATNDADISAAGDVATPETPDFENLQDWQLDRIVKIFFEDPNAMLGEIQLSQTQSGEYANIAASRRHRENSAKAAWEKMSAERKTKALTELAGAEPKMLKDKPKKPRSGKASPATQSTPHASTSFSAVRDSTPESTQDGNTKLTPTRSNRERKAVAIASTVSRRSSRLSQVSDAPSSSPTPVTIEPESDAEPARKKRRKSRAPSQGQQDSATSIIPSTAPEQAAEHNQPSSASQIESSQQAPTSHSTRKRKASPSADTSQDTDVVPAKKPKWAEQTQMQTIRRFSPMNRGNVSRASHVEVTPGSRRQHIPPRPSLPASLDMDVEEDAREGGVVTAVSVPAMYIMVPPRAKVDSVVADANGDGGERERGQEKSKEVGVSVERQKPFMEEFGSFGEYCKRMLEDCRSRFREMSKEECERVEEGLEGVEEVMRGVIKEARKAGKSKSA